MHEVPFRRAKRFPKRNFNMEAPNGFDRRGLLDLPISLPSIPIIDHLLGGQRNTPAPGNGNQNPTSPPQQNPPQSTPTPSPGDGGDSGDGGSGGNNTPPSQNPGNGNTDVLNPDNSNNNNSNNSDNSDNSGNSDNSNNHDNPSNLSNLSSLSNLGNSQNPGNPNDPDNPNSPPGLYTPNPNSPYSNSSNHSNSSPTGGPSPSQSSGGSQDGSGPNLQNTNTGDSGGLGNAIITTVSGVRTEITQVPHPDTGVTNSGNSSTGKGGDGPTNGGGGGGSSGGTNPSGGRSLNPGAIVAIVIVVVLALGLLVFFLRKRANKLRVAQRRRWLSSGEKGPRDTFRSSFGALWATNFNQPSEDDHDRPYSNRYSEAFSDVTPPMTQVTYVDITPPATAARLIGRGGSRNSEFSIGSAGSDETDSSGSQWLEIRPEVRYRDNGESSPTDQFRPSSPISVRPFTPSESWSFPKPPTSRAQSFAFSDGSRGFPDPNPFTDPVPQLYPPGLSQVEVVVTAFEPMAVDELAVEIGDEVSVLTVFDDGWVKVKVLRRDGSAENVEGLGGLVPIECLRSKGNEGPVFADSNVAYAL